MGGPTSYLVLDIETIPDPELYSPPEASTGVERPFPPLYACRPIVLGVMWFDEAFSIKRIGTIGEGKDEAGMMADFADFMTKFRPHVVTWNGRGFDLPVLALRGLRFGLDFNWYYRGEGYRYRFSEEGHLDLGDVLSDHGAARMTSLDGAARLIGLPGKDGVDGSQVEGCSTPGSSRRCAPTVCRTSRRRRSCSCATARLGEPRSGRLPAGGVGAARGDGDRRPLRPAAGRRRADAALAGRLSRAWRRGSLPCPRVLRAAHGGRRARAPRQASRASARWERAARAHRRGRGLSRGARRRLARAPRAHARAAIMFGRRGTSTSISSTACTTA